MVAVLPTELLQIIARRYPCRDHQIRELATYYTGVFPGPSTLVVHGLEETHKTDVVTAVLEARRLRYVLVRAGECLSVRHLVGKLFAGCLRTLGCESDAEEYETVDSINALAVCLEKLFRKRPAEKVVVVLDGIDDMKATSTNLGTTLLPALARLGDVIPQVSTILTTASSTPLPLHKTGIPYVYFPPYTRAEAVHVLDKDKNLILTPENIPVKTADIRKIYTQFLITVYDSLIVATASTSPSTFRKVSARLWPRFIWPAITGEEPTSQSKERTWDFARLLIRNRGLFQTEGENAMLEHLRPSSEPWTFEDLLKTSTEPPARPLPRIPLASNPQPTSTTTTASPPLLAHFPTLLLLSSHLASHTPLKNDILLFSRLASTSSGSRIQRRRMKFKSTSLTNKPSASLTPNKLTRLRNQFSLHFGAPRSFSLERVIAVLRAVHPDGIANKRGIGDRVYREMGELERMRLVVRVDDGEEGEAGGRWRVGVGKEVVVGMCERWPGVGVEEWELQE